MKKIVFYLFISSILLAGCGPEPDIQISGVKNNKIYPTEHTIHINEDIAGKYELILNDKPIKNDYEVTKDGDYQLVVHAKKWWNKETKIIHFTIDSKPPKTPRFMDLLQESYYKQVKFTLNKEEGVTYTSTLDHHPFDLSKPITEEGSHLLNVTAEKPNGLLAEQAVRFFIDNTSYSKETYDNFEKFVFDNNGQFFYFPTTMKWLHNVDVFVHGNPTETDVKILKKHLNTINHMLPINFIFQENGKGSRENKLDIYFVSNKEFSKYGYEDAINDGDWQVVGFSLPTKTVGDGEIVSSNIGIATNTLQSERKTTILHELIHSLGLYNHFENDKTSIMYPYDTTGVTAMNKMDKKLIEILYRKDIHSGMYRTDVKRVLKDHISK